MALIHSVWSSAKRWRRIRIGGISLAFRFSRNFRRRRGWLSRLRASLRARRHQPQATRHPAPAAATIHPLAGQSALIVGAGPGLGEALAERLLRDGAQVGLLARDERRLDEMAEHLRQRVSDAVVFTYGADATDERDFSRAMHSVRANSGVPDLLVYAVQGFVPGTVMETHTFAFEEAWRQNCLGAFVAARECARPMMKRGSGCIILIGSTSGLVGRAEHLNLAVGKFGLRALSQVLARELWPAGIHVAHVVVDADIHEPGRLPDGDPKADPAHIAELIAAIHRQPRSAWSSEVDVRPFDEKFWQHC